MGVTWPHCLLIRNSSQKFDNKIKCDHFTLEIDAVLTCSLLTYKYANKADTRLSAKHTVMRGSTEAIFDQFSQPSQPAYIFLVLSEINTLYRNAKVHGGVVQSQCH